MWWFEFKPYAEHVVIHVIVVHGLDLDKPSRTNPFQVGMFCLMVYRMKKIGRREVLESLRAMKRARTTNTTR